MARGPTVAPRRSRAPSTVRPSGISSRSSGGWESLQDRLAANAHSAASA